MAKYMSWMEARDLAKRLISLLTEIFAHWTIFQATCHCNKFVECHCASVRQSQSTTELQPFAPRIDFIQALKELEDAKRAAPICHSDYLIQIAYHELHYDLASRVVIIPHFWICGAI
jgi:hypothetical protein